jgi:hypothetical protein
MIIPCEHSDPGVGQGELQGAKIGGPRFSLRQAKFGLLDRISVFSLDMCITVMYADANAGD